MDTSQPASLIQLFGAGAFGLLIGWYVYYINRYRKGDVQFSDLVTLIGVLGGGAVLALFPQRTDLFGAYGIGLAVGFFAYLIVLSIQVLSSQNFNVDWFLDGRRIRAQEPWFIPEDVRPTVNAMGIPVQGQQTNTNAGQGPGPVTGVGG
ncbi:MAG TPA: hypothetical protein VGE04_11570 [Chloroflexia bacterium]